MVWEGGPSGHGSGGGAGGVLVVRGGEERQVAQLSDLRRSQRLLKLTEVPLVLWDVPLSTFVSVGSALGTGEII